jgi:hypothetical protein
MLVSQRLLNERTAVENELSRVVDAAHLMRNL